MPANSEDLGERPLMKALVLAQAKVGKTSTIIATATKSIGPGYVICCSTKEHLRGAKTLLEGKTFAFDMCLKSADIEAPIREARDGVKEGRYTWILLDDFSLYAGAVLDEFELMHKGNGRVYWAAYTRWIENQISRLLAIKAHVFVTSHYLETGKEMDGQVSKSGPGIIPAIEGAKLRQTLTGRFNQVIWMEKHKGQRIFRLSVEGVTGPGCNNLPDDVKDIPADVGLLWEALSQPTLAGKKEKAA